MRAHAYSESHASNMFQASWNRGNKRLEYAWNAPKNICLEHSAGKQIDRYQVRVSWCRIKEAFLRGSFVPKQGWAEHRRTVKRALVQKEVSTCVWEHRRYAGIAICVRTLHWLTFIFHSSAQPEPKPLTSICLTPTLTEPQFIPRH